MKEVIHIENREDLDALSNTIFDAFKNGEQLQIEYNGEVFKLSSYSASYLFVDDIKKAISRKQVADLEKELQPKNAHVISEEIVVQAMKYICEHPNDKYDEAIKGLMELGICFDYNDYKREFSGAENKSLYDAMTTAYYPVGAYIVANLFGDIDNHRYTREELFDIDQEVSAWEYIRVATGDKDYTMENVQSAMKLD